LSIIPFFTPFWNPLLRRERRTRQYHFILEVEYKTRLAAKVFWPYNPDRMSKSLVNRAIFILGVILGGQPGLAARQDYLSPDKKTLAVVNTSADTGESRFDILNYDAQDGRGYFLFSHSYESFDGEHGESISSAAWSSDSKFFVFIMENTGGHSPLMHPMDFWDRDDNQLRSLSRHVGGISAGFLMSPPDVVYAGKLDDELSDHPLFFSVSLSSVVANSTEEVAPRTAPDRTVSSDYPKRSAKTRKMSRVTNAALSSGTTFYMDLENLGRPLRYVMYWTKAKGEDNLARCGPSGFLRLRQTNDGEAEPNDDFNIGEWQLPESSAVFHLKGRNVFMVIDDTCGAAPGEEFHFFSSVEGRLYRVPFHSKPGRTQLVLSAYHVAGTGAKTVGFLDGGKRITTSEYNDKFERVFTEFEWDGYGYQEISSEICPSNCFSYSPSIDLGDPYWKR
jgi:hypothetical protein